MRNFLVHVSVFAIAVVLTDSAGAQTVPPQRPSADANRLANPERPLSFTLENNRGAGPGKPKFVETPKPDNAGEITLTLNQVTLAGADVYGEAELSQFWAPHIGKEVTLEDIYAIADRITKFYQDRGYILARAYIPAQEIEGGEVKIAIAEGQIGDVRFEGPFRVEGPLARAIDDMRMRSPLEIKRIERWTLRLNDFYGANFRVVFKNAADLNEPQLPADSVVIVVIGEREKTVDAAISFDNSGSRYLGPNSVTATAAINYHDLHFQRTQVSYTNSVPRDELKILSVQHYIPLNAQGLEIKIDAQKIDGHPGYSLKDFEIHSESKQGGIGVEWTPLRQRDRAMTLRAKLDAQNATTDILGTPFSEDRIRAIRLAARYERQRPGMITAGELRIDRGLDGMLGASERGEASLSRALGHPGFTKYGLSLSHRHSLTQNYEISGDAIAQYTRAPLLSSEEFGYGGAAFGRAYDPSEIVGDKGMSASIELRRAPYAFSFIDVQPFVFYDFGKVWNLDPGQPKTASGASAGLGARMSTPSGLAGSVAVAKPLTRAIETPQGYQDEYGPRVQFNLLAKY